MNYYAEKYTRVAIEESDAVYKYFGKNMKRDVDFVFKDNYVYKVTNLSFDLDNHEELGEFIDELCIDYGYVHKSSQKTDDSNCLTILHNPQNLNYVCIDSIKNDQSYFWNVQMVFPETISKY